MKFVTRKILTFGGQRVILMLPSKLIIAPPVKTAARYAFLFLIKMHAPVLHTLRHSAQCVKLAWRPGQCVFCAQLRLRIFYFKSLACTFRHCFTDYPRRSKKGIIVLYFGLIFVRFGALSRQNAKRKEEEKT